MKHRTIPPTTHTVEMAQIAEFNDRLSGEPRVVVTAADLTCEGSPVIGLHGHPALPGAAVLVAVSWDGDPAFPDIYGRFASDKATVAIHLHTAALRNLSHRLNLHHVWGVGVG